MREFPRVTITKKGEALLRGGHVWVYADEVSAGGAPDGELVDVMSEKGRYLGTGFFNSHSKIRIRILSDNPNDRFDEPFWRRRVRWALDYRKTVMGSDFACCRLVFGEADGLPGLTVDRFGEVLVAEVLSLGIDRRKPLLFALLCEELRAMGERVTTLYERSDSPIRALEGLPPAVGYAALPGLVAPGTGSTEITENGVRYIVDYESGQKTGFFLDQKYNRAAVARLASGLCVYDCFTHTGAFALCAAKAGAAKVRAFDISAEALETARRNAALNGLSDRISFERADVFELLTALAEQGRCDADLLILDPPAFTKSRETIGAAIRGYRAINTTAMRILRRGKYLATCSCSHFMTDSLFRRMLHDAAADAGVTLRQIAGLRQSPDHPIRWNVPETEYLKFYIFQVV